MSTSSIMPTPPEPILYVDLDGTLVTTDLLHESFLAALKRSPWIAIQCVGWLLQGRARLKEELAARAALDVTTLPYRESVLAYLREERARGRHIVLATASWTGLAEAVARHLGLFDEVLATSRECNFKGDAKAKRLLERCGAKGFDYIGDSSADFPIWAQSRHAYVVDVTGRLVGRMPRNVEVKHVFPLDAPGPRWRYALRALRPHQWAKHLLIFIPLIAAHRLRDPQGLMATLLAVAAFCLVASAGYLLNDLLDLAADRTHPRKRRRPLASGLLSIPAGIVLFGAALAAGAMIASLLSVEFQATLAAYFALTLAYSFVLKRVAMLDVLSLAAFYTLRIVAGSFAIAAAISFWLVTFSMFLFYSLALLKRYTELLALAGDGIREAPGRGYGGQDAQLILAMGSASAMVSALVLALYINGETVQALYRRPDMLWLLCPVLVYWISRMWLLASRNQMHEDPVLFALRDSASYYVAAAGAFVLWLAT
jgi:4-hydroxybenzoate polyprenyltransferase/phosphoserine phosphatase